jgi:hypothetical protein
MGGIYQIEDIWRDGVDLPEKHTIYQNNEL